MLLDTVLMQLEWTPYGIECRDPATAKVVHKFLREAVLDRHIFIHKIVSFAFEGDNAIKEFGSTYVIRHSAIGESYPEVMVNLLDKVFLTKSNNYRITLQPTMNTLQNNHFEVDGTIADTLYTNPNICRALTKQIQMNVNVAYGCKYKSVASNSVERSKGNYFPCSADFSLQDYVRVLPLTPGMSLVPLRYYNGMTLEKFKIILTDWQTFIKDNFKVTNNDALIEEEMHWLQNLEQCLKTITRP